MKKTLRRTQHDKPDGLVSVRLLIMLATMMALVDCAKAQSVPPLINYQGRLANPDGSPLPTAEYELSFRIYDAATNGMLMWGPQIFDGTAGPGRGPRMPVVQGWFNLMLGPVDTNGLSLADAFNTSNRYVEVTVSNRLPILPRQKILTTPFAFQAANGVLPGTIVAFGGDPNRILDGWLLCDATGVSSKRYPRLFEMISTNWGTGVPGTTNDFNLPDFRGLFLRGVDNSPATGSAGRDPDRGNRVPIQPGGRVGNAVGSLQQDAFEAHVHRSSLVSGVSPPPPGPTLASVGDGTFNLTTGYYNTGAAGASTETRPKNAYVNYIIKY